MRIERIEGVFFGYDGGRGGVYSLGNQVWIEFFGVWYVMMVCGGEEEGKVWIG